jgi:hypothetical protein
VTTSLDMLTCQTIGHAWYEAEANRRPAFGVLWVLRCERCTAQRDDLVDRNGDLLSRAYQYPDGYREAHLGTETQADRRARLLAEANPRPLAVVAPARARRRRTG